ncbi:hypothetical protein TNCV_2167551 [Trichonephila clavipes]|nr:hypothetical protein TNCV_2167551 [Trichonephila clavipes]
MIGPYLAEHCYNIITYLRLYLDFHITEKDPQEKQEQIGETQGNINTLKCNAANLPWLSNLLQILAAKVAKKTLN